MSGDPRSKPLNTVCKMQELVVVVQALKVNGQAPTLDSPGRAGAVLPPHARFQHHAPYVLVHKHTM